MRSPEVLDPAGSEITSIRIAFRQICRHLARSRQGNPCLGQDGWFDISLVPSLSFHSLLVHASNNAYTVSAHYKLCGREASSILRGDLPTRHEQIP
jgi:hypothetical protein